MTSKTGRKVMAGLFVTAFVMTAAPVYAADPEPQSGSMDLSISKDATYTMTIPSTTSSVTFGTVDTNIGDLSVSGDIGTKEKIHVGVTKSDFVDEKDAANTIAYNLKSGTNDFTGADWDRTAALNETAHPLTVNIPTATWTGKAPGTYKTTLSFSAEIQAVK